MFNIMVKEMCLRASLSTNVMAVRALDIQVSALIRLTRYRAKVISEAASGAELHDSLAGARNWPVHPSFEHTRPSVHSDDSNGMQQFGFQAFL